MTGLLNRDRYYAILDKHQVKCVTFDVWGPWYEDNITKRHVAKSKIGDDVEVSTVFLGLNHGFGGPEKWFETMIFGGKLDGYQRRYETWDEAVAGHELAVLEADQSALKLNWIRRFFAKFRTRQ